MGWILVAMTSFKLPSASERLVLWWVGGCFGVNVYKPVFVYAVCAERYAHRLQVSSSLPPPLHCTEEDTLKYLVLITGCFNVGKLGDVEIYRLTHASFIGLTSQSRAQDITDVAKLLSSGNFYFCSPDNSDSFSLCRSAQVHSSSSQEVTDFVWCVCVCVCVCVRERVSVCD